MRTGGYRHALIFVILVHVLYFSPILFLGDVIFPHSNDVELGGRAGRDPSLSNRKFSDQSSEYVPEINQQLRGSQRAWISTWNPYVQLGRPTRQIEGLSKAWLITHILSLFTDDPFVLYTAVTVLTVFLTGIFSFLFLKSKGLHPLACACAAIGLSLTTWSSYWLTFVMFLTPVCWTVCLLWLITRFIERTSYATAFGISFATYSLLMTGYLQFVILLGYLLGIYTLAGLWQAGGDAKRKFRTALLLSASGLSGVIMASPVLLDLAMNAARSARLDAGDAFFRGILPKIEGAKDLCIYGAQLFDPFWPGNPMRSGYPLAYEGISLTPFYGCLFSLSLFGGLWRRLWPWQLLFFLCLLGTLWPPAYLFAVRYLGFHLSPIHLAGGILVPGFLICGYVLDSLLRNNGNKKIVSGVFGACLVLVGLIWYGSYEPLHLGFVLIGCFVVAGTVLFGITRRSILLYILVVTTVMVYGFGMALMRPLESIQRQSPLVAGLKAALDDGACYAKAGRALSHVIPSNQEILLKTRSIHSYDSLSSLNYQRWVLDLSARGATEYGRHFNTMESHSGLGGEAFSYAGVGCVLSREPLDKEKFRKTVEVNGIGLYEPKARPILVAQLLRFDRGKTGKDVRLRGFLGDQKALGVKQSKASDDFKCFEVTPCADDTLLFLSQQYHPQWRAHTANNRLRTVVVNGFYQGVMLPPHTGRVELAFKPLVLWSWIPQFIYLVAGVLLLVYCLGPIRTRKPHAARSGLD